MNFTDENTATVDEEKAAQIIVLGLKRHPQPWQGLVSASENPAYAQTYNALITLGHNTGLAKPEQLLALICAAYGWMPTSLREISKPGLSWLADNIVAVRDATHQNAITLIPPLNCTFSGKSWIGTSKVLHFLNPRAFPIWDSRVASRFGLNGYRNVNQRENYVAYVGFMAQKIQHHADRLSAWNNHANCTEMRLLELFLFIG